MRLFCESFFASYYLTLFFNIHIQALPNMSQYCTFDLQFWKWHFSIHNSNNPLAKEKNVTALHKDGLGYKKIAKTLKVSCSMVAKTIQRFNRTTQNRPRHGRPKKLSAHAQRHIQRLALENRRTSAASIAVEVEGVGVSLSVLRPYTTHCIKLVSRAIIPEGSLS